MYPNEDVGVMIGEYWRELIGYRISLASYRGAEPKAGLTQCHSTWSCSREGGCPSRGCLNLGDKMFGAACDNLLLQTRRLRLRDFGCSEDVFIRILSKLLKGGERGMLHHHVDGLDSLVVILGITL
uniref:Uncharacterized protein n=1 Tax=Ascaris lumbricoides TaxID=6252 RepID=A0A9J2PDT6_ASCLU